jgi:hypothetical protein
MVLAAKRRAVVTAAIDHDHFTPLYLTCGLYLALI